MERVLAACLSEAVRGEMQHGSGTGVVFLKTAADIQPASTQPTYEGVGFLLLDQVQPDALREGLLQEMEKDDGESFFILHQHGGSVHVSKLARNPPG